MGDLQLGIKVMTAAFDVLIHSEAAGGRVSSAFTLRQSSPANNASNVSVRLRST